MTIEGDDVIWLEYRYHPQRQGRKALEWKNDAAVVSYETAARRRPFAEDDGPFKQLITGHHFLPNIASSFCTDELKVFTCSRFLARHLGLRPGRREIKAKNGNDARPRVPNEWIDLIGFRRDEPLRALPRILDTDVAFPLFDAKITRAEVQAFWNDPHRKRPEVMAQFSKRYSYQDLVAQAKAPQLIDVEDVSDEPAACFSGYCGETA